MTHTLSASNARAARLRAAMLAVLVALAAAAFATSAAGAASSSSRQPRIAASLEQSPTAVPVDGSLGFTAVIRLPEAASYVQARVQVRRSGGKLVYQRTQTLDNAPAGPTSFTFTRDLAGLDLKPGAYPVRLAVTANLQGSTVETEVASELLVYDADKPAVPVVLVARVTGPPLSDPQGRLVLNPAVETGRREAVERIAAIALADPDARVTLAVPPLMLEEWRRLTSGYTRADGTAVPADDATPRAYADALAQLKNALATGRLELVSLGYADPNLDDLVAERLGDDAAPQYDAGISACFASLETTPSTGTVPAGGCAPPSVLNALVRNGIAYVATDGSCAKIGRSAAPSGAYPVAGMALSALVFDDQASRAIITSGTQPVLRRVFGRLGAAKAVQPFAVRIDLGERADATATVGAAVAALESVPWTRMVLGREAAASVSGKTVALLAGKPSSGGSEEFRRALRSARSNAVGMIAALGPGDPDATSAQATSLVAESSAWTAPASPELLARGVEFAEASLRISRAVLGEVHIKASAVTLPGAKGTVPINIENSTQKTLSVIVRAGTSGGVEVSGPKRIPTVLRPQETFVEIPVDMKSSLAGKLTVEVVAGSAVIARQTIDVRGSYLDRIAIVGGIIFVLAVILALIVVRVRRSPDEPYTETATDADADSARYTEPSRARRRGERT